MDSSDRSLHMTSRSLPFRWLVPLASIANIHRRSSSDDGFCVVTAAGDEYRFWGGDHYDVSYDEWSQMLRKAAESNGNRLPRRTTSRQ